MLNYDSQFPIQDQLSKMSQEERQKFLHLESIDHEVADYQEPIDQEATKVLKEDLSLNVVEAHKLSRQIRELNKEKKEFTAKVSEIASELEDGMVHKQGTLYQIPDPEHKLVHYISDSGWITSSRPMKANEFQTRIKFDHDSLRKQG